LRAILTTLLTAAALAMIGGHGAPVRAAEALTVCLDEDIPLYSVHHGSESTGFDFAVAEAVAKHLGRPLEIQWFESKLDMDDSSVLGANALLSDGHCQLVAGYPLVRDALGKPGIGTARLPDFDGAKPGDRRRRVTLGALVPTHAYHRAPLTIVLSGAATAKPIKGLADLKGLKLGVEAATLGDAILMLYRDGVLVDQITHLVPGRGELMPRLEKGDFDATLVDLRRFDAYRAEHPDSKLGASGFYYRIGFNLGFVGLSTDAALIEQVNQAIEALLAKDEIAPLAKANRLTYLPPEQPEILEHLTLTDLRHD
jgi:ABC-type amino acid transport substrate-binding protein